MTTLKNRPNTALLVVDAQNVVVEGAHGRDAVVANGDSFEDSVLETVLLGLGVGRLVVVGAETDACVRSTLHGAFVRGYDATLVSDAHTAGDRTAWGRRRTRSSRTRTSTGRTRQGRTAGTVETKDVDFGGTS
jgi:nicotinamidase-related amidase